MKLVLDTDIFIDFLREYTPAKTWFAQLEWEHVLFSAITEAELLSGSDCINTEAQRKTLLLLQPGIKIPVTNEIAKETGKLRRVYNIPIMDAFIAATALLYKAKVITRNFKHFKRVKGLLVEKPY
jgi:predicted nucleic acid-binding protein